MRDEVRDLVEVLPHNLVTEAPPFGPGEVDLVGCRNAAGRAVFVVSLRAPAGLVAA